MATTRDLDRIDRKILETLQLDGRITNQDLSNRIALSPRACLERVRRLERAGIISGYMALIEPRKLGGVLTVVVEVTLRDQKQATHARFEQRAREPKRWLSASWYPDNATTCCVWRVAISIIIAS